MENGGRPERRPPFCPKECGVGPSEFTAAHFNLVAGINGRVGRFAVKDLVAIDLVALAVGPGQNDIAMVGKVGEIAGGGYGLGDSDLADVNLAAFINHFATDVKHAVAGFHGDGQMGVNFGNVEIVDDVLQLAGGFAGSLDGANVGQGKGSVFIDGFLLRVQRRWQSVKSNCDRVADMKQ